MHSKQILDYFAVSNVIAMHIIKTPEVFEAPTSLQSSLRPLADFEHAFCMTHRLQTVPYKYQQTKKPAFAKLQMVQNNTDIA